MENYVTKQEVADAIAAIPKVNLDPYALKSELPDITGLASEEYVVQKIAEAELDKDGVDLSAYYTKGEVDDKLNELVIPELPDLSDFATKEEIPSVEGLATETYVQEQINAIEHP